MNATLNHVAVATTSYNDVEREASRRPFASSKHAAQRVPRSATLTTGLALLCALAALPRAAEAQAPSELGADAPPAPLPGAEPEREVQRRPRLEQRTAYTVAGGQLELGLLTADYGITDRLAVGIDPPAWAARAVLPIWVPNAHVEWTALRRAGLALSLAAGGYFADLQGGEDAGGTLVVIPVSVFASGRLAPRWWLHGEATYLFADASGTGDLNNADLEGSVSTRAGQLGAMLEYQLTRVVSLTAVGRYQVYSGRLVFAGTTAIDDYTTADVEGQLEPRVQHPWQAIAGAAFLWPRVRLQVGVGYGHLFIPGIALALSDRFIVPDLSLSVVL
jgi:hypothetical protein